MLILGTYARTTRAVLWVKRLVILFKQIITETTMQGTMVVTNSRTTDRTLKWDFVSRWTVITLLSVGIPDFPRQPLAWSVLLWLRVLSAYFGTVFTCQCRMCRTSTRVATRTTIRHSLSSFAITTDSPLDITPFPFIFLTLDLFGNIS